MPTFFQTSNDFRNWLHENHDKITELWVGFYKKATGKPSITWPESVDQALCYGWIDGIRKRIDEEAYMVRFTPRKPDSHWSNVNINKIKELRKEKLVMASGLAAFKRRKSEKSGQASFEQKKVELPEAFEQQIRQNEKAADYFYNKQTPSYRKQVSWWIISAKQEVTQLKRLNILIASSEKGEVTPPMKWTIRS